MALARRDLLGIGASLAVSFLATSCGADPRPPARTAPRSATTAPEPGPSSASPRPRGVSRNALKAGPGQVYYGASVPYDRSVSDWEQELGSSLAVNRSFFTAHDAEVEKLVSECLDDIAHRRLPHVSMKPRGTWREVADGTYDEWLGSMLTPLAATRAPILFTLHHEPENDAGPPGMQPADFVAMQRHLIELAAGASPRVVVCPVLQQWTFDPVRDDVDPAAWLVPEAAVMGLDVYNHWSPNNGKPWRSFGSRADEALGWFGDVPIAIGEYGCREDPRNPGLAAEWLRDAAQYAREHNVVSMAYYNSSLNAPEGSWEMHGRTERTFADLLASDWVVRPSRVRR